MIDRQDSHVYACATGKFYFLDIAVNGHVWSFRITNTDTPQERGQTLSTTDLENNLELPVYVFCGACNESVSENLIMAYCPCGHPICCNSPCRCEGVWDHLKWFARDRYDALDEKYVLVRKISHFPIWCRKTILTFLRKLNRK